MKHFKRIFTIAIMFVLSLSFVIVSPVANLLIVSAASITSGSGLVIKGFNDKGEIGTLVSIPRGTTTSGKKVNVVIKNPKGIVISESEYHTSSNTETIFINPTMIGYYTVQYFVENDITKSEIYSIYVDGTRPSISFEDNAEIYLPEKIYAEKDGTVFKVELPEPVVKNSDAEEIDFELLIRNGVNAETSLTDKEDVYVSAIDPNYNTVNLYRQNGKIYFEATVKDGEYVYGSYTFTYFYQDNGLTAKKYVTVVVEKDYDKVVENINLTFVWNNSSSLPTSGTLGQSLQLPKPVLQDKNRDNLTLQSYTTVKVDYIPNGDLDGEWVSYNGSESKDFDYSTFSFIPMNKTENGGYYRIEYTITDYYGNKIEKQIYKIQNVTSSQKPDLYLVNEYTVSDAQEGTVDLTDLSYLIPNRIIISTDGEILYNGNENLNGIILPAIYAKDSYSPFDDLDLRRYFITGTTQIRLDTRDESTQKYNTNQLISIRYDSEGLNETVKNCLKTAGTYKIRYEVYNGVNTSTTMTFEIVVVERNFVDTVAPEIEMPVIDKVAFEGNTVTFQTPKISDDVTERCHIEVGYYYGTNFDQFIADFNSGKALKDCADYENFKYIDKMEDNTSYYSFEVPSIKVGSELKVVVRAIDNAKFGEANDVIAKNNVTVKTANIRLVAIDNTVTPPAFDYSQLNVALDEYAQNETISITDISSTGQFIFTGKDCDFTDISVKVYDPNDKELSISGLSTKVNASNDEITVKGGKFTSTKKGQYIVTISAKDIAGNVTIVSYSLVVKDTMLPVIYETGTLPTTIVVGQEVVIPDCIMMDDGVITENKAENPIDFDVEGYDNPDYTFIQATNTFIAKQAGVFKFNYVVSDGINEPVIVEKSFTVVANTSTTETQFDESDWYDKASLEPIIENEVDTGKYTLIALPYLNITAKVKSYSVIVQNSKGQEISVIAIADLNRSEHPVLINEEKFDEIFGAFEPTAKDGTYTVIYTVETDAGQIETTKTLKVGDLIAPTITINNPETNFPSNATLGSELKIKASDIICQDEVTDSDEITLVVTIKLSDGTVRTLSKDSDGYYTYTFETAGTYTLNYVATDIAGNESAEKSTTIVVGAEGAQETNITVIWSAVLIILAIAVCAGIIIFFVVNNKRKVVVEKTKR